MNKKFKKIVTNFSVLGHIEPSLSQCYFFNRFPLLALGSYGFFGCCSLFLLVILFCAFRMFIVDKIRIGLYSGTTSGVGGDSLKVA